MGRRARKPQRYAAHWVSPHGGLRLFLAVGDTRESAHEAALRTLPATGLSDGRDVIHLTPIAWADDDSETTQRRAG
jgi:hypothetical protein